MILSTRVLNIIVFKSPEGGIKSSNRVGSPKGTIRHLRSYKGMSMRQGPHEWSGIPPWFWPRIARELPIPPKKPFLKSRRKGGRPRCDDRKALSAILWRLRSGGTWNRLPKRFGSAMTARRRQAAWMRGGRLDRAWRAYLQQQSRVELHRWRGCFAAASFLPQPFWRFDLDLIWQREFEPALKD